MSSKDKIYIHSKDIVNDYNYGASVSYLSKWYGTSQERIKLILKAAGPFLEKGRFI